MGDDRAIQKAEHGDIRFDTQTTARVVESLVLRGDISALTPEERARFYLQTCESLGLTPGALPFAVLRLNGKEILYPTRGATDQLAAIHRLTRKIIDGPRVIDIAGTKFMYAVCEASHPNGRVETAVATVPMNDPANVMMKCETKAKRRATLSILGLGMLDESELDTVPEHLKSEPSQPVQVQNIHIRAAKERASAAQPSAPTCVAHQTLRDQLPSVETIDQAEQVYIDYLDDILEQTSRDPEAIKKAMDDVILHLESKGVVCRTELKKRWQEHERQRSAKVREKIANESEALKAFNKTVECIELPGESIAAWLKYRAELAKLPEELKQEAWKALCKRTEEVVSIKNGAAWLKKAIAEEDQRIASEMRDDGAKPAEDPDPEREAIQQADGIAPTATPYMQLEAKLKECTNTEHLYNVLWKYGCGKVDKEDCARLAAERMHALGANLMTALGAVRDEMKRRGWKPTTAA